MLGVYGTAALLLASCWPVDLFTCLTSLEVVNETLWRTACWSGIYETAVTALSGLAGGDDAHEGGELNAWSPERVAEEPTALSLPCLPPESKENRLKLKPCFLFHLLIYLSFITKFYHVIYYTYVWVIKGYTWIFYISFFSLLQIFIFIYLFFLNNLSNEFINSISMTSFNGCYIVEPFTFDAS